MTRNSYKIWLAPCILLFFGILIQMHTYLDWDVIWLMKESQIFINGGNYLRNFFDPNPPFILYLYSPAALLINLTHLDLVTVTRCYLFLLALFSLGLCWAQLRHIIPQQQTIFTGLMLAGLALVLFILPGQEFGQREHLLVIFILPYVLSLNNVARYSTSSALRLLIAILAGLGFCIKPYFLIIFIFLELYLFILKPKITTLFRLENSIICLVIILYLVSLFLFTPIYIHSVLPFVKNYYLGYASLNRLELINNLFVLSTLIAIILAVFSLIKLPNKILITTLLLATLGSSISFFIAAEPWYYHLIPQFSFTILLLCALLANLMLNLTFTALKASHLVVAICLIDLVICLQSIYIRLLEDVSRPTEKEYPPTYLVNYIKNHPTIHSLLAFSTHPGMSVLAAHYAHITNCSRFTGFWMMPKIATLLAEKESDTQLRKSIDFVRNTVTEDFERCQPDIVIVDTAPEKLYFSVPFDYISFFQQDPKFKKIWHHYQLAEEIPGFAIYSRSYAK